MTKFIFILCNVSLVLLAQDFDPEAARKLAKQCDAIFEARKQEINSSLLQLQQQQSTLQILTTENTKLLKEKEEQLKLKEEALKKMYSDMRGEQSQKQSESDAKLEEAKKILAKNEEVLKQITEAKDNKLSQGYAKMKESKAAPILSAMPNDDAVAILLSLKPNQMGGILAQMQPNKAAELTELIKKYPNKQEPAKVVVPPQETKPSGINTPENISSNSNAKSANIKTGTTIY